MSIMSRHPHIHLLTYHESDKTTFETAIESYPLPASYSLSYHTGSLRALDPTVKFDLAVSPANSYGLMDGGYDDALSREFSPNGEYYTLTRAVQKHLWQECRGYAPPGSCTLVPFDFSAEQTGAGATSGRSGNTRGCRLIAVCPTMRTPQDVTWDREIVYECVWSLLCAVDKWNRSCKAEEKVSSMLMTPLATGVGRISAWKWATQALLALGHFDEALTEEEKWSSLDWKAVSSLDEELEATHSM